MLSDGQKSQKYLNVTCKRNQPLVAEMKASISQMKKHKNEINQHLQALIVPSDGKSGGLALMWKEDADVRVQSYSHSHIDAIVHDACLNIT